METRRPFIQEAWDFYRTAPLAEALLATISLPALKVIALDGLDNPPVLVTKAILLGMLLIEANFCVNLAKKQFRLRQRLEGSIQQYGYADEAFETTVSEWCARQTATVVTDRSGNREQFQKLCQRSRDKMQLKFIPNF